MKLPRGDCLHLAAGVAALLALSQPAHTQGYPSGPITMIVPFENSQGTLLRLQQLAPSASRRATSPLHAINSPARFPYSPGTVGHR